MKSDPVFIEDFCKVLETNKCLLHMDLSNNHFSFAQSELISRALTQNHYIYGLHFSGNRGYVDSQQYLKVTDDNYRDNLSCHFQKELNGIKKASYNMLSQHETIHDLKNSCWICDGWIEEEFQFDVSKLNNSFNDLETSDVFTARAPVFIHFKHENYQAIFMPHNDEAIPTI